MIDCLGLGLNPISRSRFRPPQLVPNQEVLWALRRAFGPPGGVFGPPPHPKAALSVARRLDLGPRIACRVARGVLESELGREPAAALVADRGLQAMAADAAVEDARRIAASGHPIVLLKGVALIARGVVAPGARALADLDLLVSERELASCAEGLRDLGYVEARGSVASDHQLPALVRDGRSVDVHRFLPGVRVPGQTGFATIEALDRAGLIENRPGWPEAVSVPRPPLLAAHAAVHGLAQHGLAPRSYPLTRMLADLVDLRVHADPVLAAEAHALVAREIPREEWDELLATCCDLEAGVVADRPLLAHAVFGLLDDDYAASLKLRALGAVPSTLPWPLLVVREAWRALFPGRERLQGLHPGGKALALKRPFAMLGRGLAALWKRRAWH